MPPPPLPDSTVTIASSIGSSPRQHSVDKAPKVLKDMVETAIIFCSCPAFELQRQAQDRGHVIDVEEVAK